MYVGVYKRVDDDDYLETTIRYADDLDLTNRLAIAEYHVKWDHKRYGGIEYHVQARRERAQRLFQEEESEKKPKARKEWSSLEEKKQDEWTYMTYLIETDYKWDVAPVKFVRYDEALYQSLVKFDCIMGKRKKKQVACSQGMAR